MAKRNNNRVPQDDAYAAFPDVFRTGLTAPQVEFLLEVIHNGSINSAAKALSRATPRKKRSPEAIRQRHYESMKSRLYSECYAAAKNHVGGALEDEAFRRARDGVLEPVFGRDGLLGHRRVYDGSLLKLLLQVNHEKYRPTESVIGARVEVVHYGASPPPPGWTAGDGPAPGVRVSLPSKETEADKESASPPENSGKSPGSPPPDSPGESPGRQRRT